MRDLLSPIEANEYPRTVLDAYCYWLKIRTYYGWQVPIDRVLARNPATEAQPALELTTWLWNRRDSARHDPESLSPAQEPRRCLCERHQGRARGTSPEGAGPLVRLDDPPGRGREAFVQRIASRLDESADGTLANLDFAVHYRYGTHLGWDIPNWKEWEKAYRGADARAYTWGNSKTEDAWVNRGQHGGLVKPLSEAQAISTVNDQSPYGVFHMAGNLSEWVRVSDPPVDRVRLHDGRYTRVPVDTAWNAYFPDRVFLKGGNYVMGDSLSAAGYTLSLPSENSSSFGSSPRVVETLWTGFRVLRRIPNRGDQGN